MSWESRFSQGCRRFRRWESSRRWRLSSLREFCFCSLLSWWFGRSFRPPERFLLSRLLRALARRTRRLTEEQQKNLGLVVSRAGRILQWRDFFHPERPTPFFCFSVKLRVLRGSVLRLLTKFAPMRLVLEKPVLNGEPTSPSSSPPRRVQTQSQSAEQSSVRRQGTDRPLHGRIPR